MSKVVSYAKTIFKKPKDVLGTDLTRNRFFICVALLCSNFFIWGLSYGLLDSLNKHFQDLFGITKAQSTGLQGVYFGAYFVFSVPSAFYIRQVGYKAAIITALSIFGTNSLLFWPAAEYERYWPFLIITFMAACGITMLEVCSNSYLVALAGEKAALYLTFAQGFNGIASVAGPLIASQYFFTGANLTSFSSVQYVYVSVAAVAVTLAILYAVIGLPEIRQESTKEEEEYVQQHGFTGLFKRKRLMFGFIAETLYTGAQVSLASIAINYFVETTEVSSAQAANLYAYCQMTFMAGRFISVPILHFIHPPVILAFYATSCFVFLIATSTIQNRIGSAVCLFIVFFFESAIYPVIFSEATRGLGPYQKYGSAMIAMGVAGGAWFPSIQATVADDKTTQISFIVPAIGYFAVSMYGYYLWINDCKQDGFHIRVLPLTPEEEIKVLEQSMSRVSDSSKTEKGSMNSEVNTEKDKIVEIEEIEEVEVK